MLNIEKFIESCKERIRDLQSAYMLTDDYIESKILTSQINLLTNLVDDLITCTHPLTQPKNSD